MVRRLAAWRMIRFLIILGIFCANPALIHAACDASTFAQAVQNLITKGYTPVTQPDAAATIGYFQQSIKPIDMFKNGDTLCLDALSSSGSSALVGYTRTAVFETPTLYKTAMDDLVASGVTSQVVIGITNSDSTEVMNCYWTSKDGAQYCAIFVDAGGYVSVPTAYSIGPIGNSGTKTPYVFTVIPSNPYRFIPMYDANLGLPVICEFGCGTAPSYTRTPEWANTPPSVGSTTGSIVRSTTTAPSKTSTTTPAASSSQDPAVSTPSGAPSTCSAGGPAYFCNQLQSSAFPTVVVDNICYAISSIPINSRMFNATYDFSVSLISTNGASSYVDYGRIAVFKTPALYRQVMTAFVGKTNKDLVMIGATIMSSDLGTNLSEYFWTNDGYGTYMSRIFSLDGVTAGTIPASYSLSILDDPNPFALSVDPAKPNQFVAIPFYAVPTGILAVFEYGCGNGMFTACPDWLGDTTTTTRTIASSSSTSSTVQSTYASGGSSSNCTKSYALIASCVIATPTDSHPNIAKPQDCANLCTATVGCRSFNFKLGDASCGRNTCDLFDQISSDFAVDASATTSASAGACYHYDSV